MGRHAGGTNRKWSFEDKKRIVARYFDEHFSLNNLAKIENVSLGTLYNWVAKFYEFGEEGLVSKKRGNQFAALHSSKSLSEVDRLKLEVLKKDIEIARLKKGYQVKGVGVNKVYVTSKGKIIK